VTVTVSEHYVPSCEECCAAVERIVRAAVRDFSVTKLSLTPGHRHNHDTERALPSPTAEPTPPSGELFVDGTAGNSAGALNGFDHAAGEGVIANCNANGSLGCAFGHTLFFAIGDPRTGKTAY